MVAWSEEVTDELPPLLAFPMRGDGALTREVVRLLRSLHSSADFQIAAYQSPTDEGDFTFEILPWYPDPPLFLERAPGYRFVGLADLNARRVVPIVEDVTRATIHLRSAPCRGDEAGYSPMAQLILAAVMLWALGIWPFEE